MGNLEYAKQRLHDGFKNLQQIRGNHPAEKVKAITLGTIANTLLGLLALKIEEIENER